jgi:hypothetical protein
MALSVLHPAMNHNRFINLCRTAVNLYSIQIITSKP